MVVNVAKDAGNSTFRVVFDGVHDDDARWRELMLELEPFECWFDVRNPRYVALSAPPAHAQGVAVYLNARERRGELSFETGRSRPPRSS